MGAKEANGTVGISSMEMLAMGGFALFFGWMFISFYWLFCEFPPGVSSVERDFVQLFLFAAVPLGFVRLHFAARSPRFNLFAARTNVYLGIASAALPAVALVMRLGVSVPLEIMGVANIVAGFAAAGVHLAWLDVCSRLKGDHYSRFTGLSMFAGGLLFVLVTFLPVTVQPIFGIVFILASVGLLGYVSLCIEGNEQRAPLESVESTRRFTRQVEPSFFMLGVVFAFTFLFLFNSGANDVLFGLAFTLVGSLAVAVLSMLDRQLDITVYQRVLAVVAVAACVFVPFVGHAGQIACSCVSMAAWAMFVSVNNSHLVKECTMVREAPLFRQAPLRLMVPTLGFAVGWAIATFGAFLSGAHADAFVYMRFGVAILLVIVVMVLAPAKMRHAVDGSSPPSERAAVAAIAADRSEGDLLEARCDAVTRLYQLSPRESEVLALLAEGHDAAYIQEALAIPAHAVESHANSLYHKLDVDSQQKLMGFVEQFPLDG